MNEDLLNDYQKQVECEYKNEHYSVRDNGSILRHPKDENNPRKNDNQWTFGKLGAKGYLYLSGVQVHRIVATAFHGVAPSSQHIVDHKDTNRQNNRPENLQWLTKLENALSNPITRKRIIFVCGSIEAFLKNPSLLGSSKLDKNFSWMRTVTAEEAKISRERLEEWAKSDATPSGGSLGEWIYEKPKSNFKADNKNQLNKYHDNFIKNEYTEPEVIDSLTPGTKQVYARWRIPAEFPCAPQDGEERTLERYLEKLKHGVVFSKSNYGSSIVDKAAFTKEKDAIIVKTYSDSEGNVKSGGHNSKITYKDGYFIHETLGSYFVSDGAEKYYRLAIGEEWTGGDVIDDFC